MMAGNYHSGQMEIFLRLYYKLLKMYSSQTPHNKFCEFLFNNTMNPTKRNNFEVSKERNCEVLAHVGKHLLNHTWPNNFVEKFVL